MNVVLSPDKSNALLKMYHLSNKLTLPLILSSIIGEVIQPNKKDNLVFHVPNVLNISYHSYFSCSSVITDYVKITNVSKISRVLNLNLHLLATYGFVRYLTKRDETV